MSARYPAPPEGNAPVYFATGEDIWTCTFTLVQRVEDPSLGFTIALAPDTERIHIGYPAAWGAARFVIDGFPQTGAFSGPRVLEVAGVACFFYSSNKRIRSASVEVQVI